MMPSSLTATAISHPASSTRSLTRARLSLNEHVGTSFRTRSPIRAEFARLPSLGRPFAIQSCLPAT